MSPDPDVVSEAGEYTFAGAWGGDGRVDTELVGALKSLVERLDSNKPLAPPRLPPLI